MRDSINLTQYSAFSGWWLPIASLSYFLSSSFLLWAGIITTNLFTKSKLFFDKWKPSLVFASLRIWFSCSKSSIFCFVFFSIRSSWNYTLTNWYVKGLETHELEEIYLASSIRSCFCWFSSKPTLSSKLPFFISYLIFSMNLSYMVSNYSHSWLAYLLNCSNMFLKYWRFLNR